jgi:hypothetical protein
VFAIGDAGYPSLEPEDFSSADLSTLEGNFYFTLTIELSGATLLIGDVELVGLALSDPDSPTYVLFAEEFVTPTRAARQMDLLAA